MCYGLGAPEGHILAIVIRGVDFRSGLEQKFDQFDVMGFCGTLFQYDEVS